MPCISTFIINNVNYQFKSFTLWKPLPIRWETGSFFFNIYLITYIIIGDILQKVKYFLIFIYIFSNYQFILALSKFNPNIIKILPEILLIIFPKPLFLFKNIAINDAKIDRETHQIPEIVKDVKPNIANGMAP